MLRTSLFSPDREPFKRLEPAVLPRAEGAEVGVEDPAEPVSQRPASWYRDMNSKQEGSDSRVEEVSRFSQRLPTPSRVPPPGDSGATQRRRPQPPPGRSLRSAGGMETRRHIDPINPQTAGLCGGMAPLKRSFEAGSSQRHQPCSGKTNRKKELQTG